MSIVKWTDSTAHSIFHFIPVLICKASMFQTFFLQSTLCLSVRIVLIETEHLVCMKIRYDLIHFLLFFFNLPKSPFTSITNEEC